MNKEAEKSAVSVTDEQLVDLYRSGDTQAFTTLISRYERELFHFLFRFTGRRGLAEDVFQEAFLQVHLSINTFDTSRKFKPWLFTIAANKARDQLRRKSQRPAAQLSARVDDSNDDGPEFVDLMEADLVLPDVQVEQEETQQLVREAVESLPDHLREILLLAYFHKLAYSEIAEALEIPLGTVKSRLHAAVASFAQQWKRHNAP